MAENKPDDLLEEESSKSNKKDNDEAEQPEKGGLTTSLLIKVAIGLGVVLVAMVVAFFLFSGSPETENQSSEETAVSETKVDEVDEQRTEEESVVTPESGTIELPPLTATKPPAETTTSTTTAESNTVPLPPATATSQPAAASNASSAKVLAEIVALQKQLESMQQENQRLIKRVEQLTQESETLQSRLPQSSSSKTITMTDERFVDNDDVPLYYRENRYSNTPQPELKPQWGEFQQAR